MGNSGEVQDLYLSLDSKIDIVFNRSIALTGCFVAAKVSKEAAETRGGFYIYPNGRRNLGI